MAGELTVNITEDTSTVNVIDIPATVNVSTTDTTTVNVVDDIVNVNVHTDETTVNVVNETSVISVTDAETVEVNLSVVDVLNSIPFTTLLDVPHSYAGQKGKFPQVTNAEDGLQFATAVITEVDPVFTASPAHSITNTDITHLSNLSGTNTGDETASTIKTKLGITILSGANTGDQDLSGYQLTSGKNQNLGYCGLDSGGKVPIGNLPTTLLKYMGVWNANTNTPTLVNPDTSKIGNVYNVSVAGTQFGISWALGDWLIYNASGVPEKSKNSDDVTSVNSQTGAVVLTTDNISEGSTNKYDKTVVLTQGSNVTITGTYPNFTINSTASSTGDVVGPNSSTNNHIAFFDGTTGKLIKDSGLTLSGSNTGDQDLSPYLTSSTAASTYTPLTRKLTINGTQYDLSADRSWTISVPSVGTWGALNYPTWVSGTPFVKMTAAGTFALDTTTYLTSLSHTALTDMPSSTNTDHDLRYVTKVQGTTPSTPTPFAGMTWFDTSDTSASFTTGNLSASSPLRVTGGTNAVIGAGATVDINWSTFKLSNLTTNGFVKVSGGDGTMSVDTTTYLTASDANLSSYLTIANAATTYAKLDATNQPFTGTITVPGFNLSTSTASTIASFDASKNLISLATATYPSLTELTYVKGVTSAIQTQFGAIATDANIIIANQVFS